MYKLHYIYECLSGELNIPARMSLIDVENVLLKKGDSRQSQKILNLSYTYDQFLSKESKTVSKDLTKKIHGTIMHNLLENAGKYRVRDAAPSGQLHQLYTTPSKIDKCLNNLLKCVQSPLPDPVSLTECIRLSAYFFSTFLKIHPFSNGNGRTAKVLLSLLLEKQVGLPVLVRNSKEKRTYYLECLEDTEKLARFVLESIFDSLNLFLFTLEE